MVILIALVVLACAAVAGVVIGVIAVARAGRKAHSPAPVENAAAPRSSPPLVAPPSPQSAEPAAPEATARKRPVIESTLECVPPDRLPRFYNVGGMQQVKEELLETLRVVLDDTGIAQQYEIEWNGVLLHGPPGVGKTLLARATAGELGIGYIAVNTADVVSKWIGEGPGKVDAAFRFAKKHTPCVLFFDEFDSLAAHRDGDSHVEYRRLTNQLLESLEEYRNEHSLVVMAATNAYDTLDPAVIRAGRFDRHIEVTLPDREARGAILTVHLGSRPVADDINIDELAELSEGLTGADLETIIDEAALEAASDAVEQHLTIRITQASLLQRLQRVLDQS